MKVSSKSIEDLTLRVKTIKVFMMLNLATIPYITSKHREKIVKINHKKIFNIINH